MSHFAELNASNIVVRVIVGPENLTDTDAKSWCETVLGGRWVQTSYTGSIRGRFAGPGMRYNENLDVFEMV